MPDEAVRLERLGEVDRELARGCAAVLATVADVNGDDWLDLVCPFYRGAGRRSWYSNVLLGGEDGYGADRSIQLPTNGATGSIVSDFNRDGYQDIFFFCHRVDGSPDEIGAAIASLTIWR